MPVKPLRKYYDHLTVDQEIAVEKIEAFLGKKQPSVFLLKGYAGSGKTFLLEGLLAYLKDQERTAHCLAPTGRAARIIQEKTGKKSFTIHKHIYKRNKQNIDLERDDYALSFYVADSPKNANDVYLIDESSMIGDTSQSEALLFGSGRLLQDLFEYLDFQGNPDSKVIFIGDGAQLFPVFETLSPALSADYLKQTFKLDTEEIELTEVVRQKSESFILQEANRIRDGILKGDYHHYTPDPKAGEIELYMGKVPLLNQYFNQLKDFRDDNEQIIICHSNSKAQEYNQVIRDDFFEFMPERHLQVLPDDVLIVMVNNYHEEFNLMNGEFLKVSEVDTEVEEHEVVVKNKKAVMYQKDRMTKAIDLEKVLVTLRFRDIEVYNMDDEQRKIIRIKILENFVFSEFPNPPHVIRQALFRDLYHRISDANPELNPSELKSMISAAMDTDKYFNAVIVKFGYAITCHKAQGGEWPYVYIDSYRSDKHPKASEEYLRWMYTAMTRASQRLVISAPHKFFD